MKLNEIKTYFIVLKSRPERVVNVQAQIAMNDIKNHEIIEAVNGNDMTEEFKSYWLDPKNFYGFHIKKTKKETVLGRVGCTLSHFNALTRAIKANEFPCIIAEDDVLLELKERIIELPNLSFTLMVYLGGTYSRHLNKPITKEFVRHHDCGNYWRLDGKELKMFCTIGYLIPNKESAEFILNKLKNKIQKRTIDTMLVREIQTHGYCYAIKEPVAFQMDMISMASDYGKIQKLDKYGCVTRIKC